VENTKLKIQNSSQAPVAYSCNPRYSGGNNQEDHSSKPAQENSSRDPTLKIPNTKKGWWSGSRCRPWVQALVPKKKKENSRKAGIQLKK
jgi:hypothetical protein